MAVSLDVSVFELDRAAVRLDTHVARLQQHGAEDAITNSNTIVTARCRRLRCASSPFPLRAAIACRKPPTRPGRSGVSGTDALLR